jgi:uncharacterized protein
MLELSSDEVAEVRLILDRVLGGDGQVWVFGSRATGKARRFSDLDLLVRADGPLPFAKQAELEEAFSESGLSFRVDVVDWYRISDEFRERIADERVRFDFHASA